jgi:FtsH-binding integral membrane protein
MRILHHFFLSRSSRHYGSYSWMGISIVTPKVVTCTNDCITTVFDAKPFGWLLIVFSLTMMFFIIRGMIKR